MTFADLKTTPPLSVERLPTSLRREVGWGGGACEISGQHPDVGKLKTFDEYS